MVPGGASGRLGLAALAIALFLFFALRHENFVTADNVLTISLSMSSTMIAVVGTTLLLISGNVDLSIGSMYALIAVTVGLVASETGNAALAVLTGLMLGTFLGALNGVLVRVLKINPLIVTLAMLAAYGGLAFAVSGGASVFGFPEAFTALGRAGLGRLTTPSIVAIILFIALSVWLARSRTGLRVYAIGGDERAARLNGVAVGRTIIGLFAVNGLLIGVVAILGAARLGSASPTLGTGFELDVLTAAILGGVAFKGGAGRPLGVFFGVAVIGIMNAGLLFEGLADYYQQIAKGGLLLVALGADQFAQQRRERRDAGRAIPNQAAEAAAPEERTASTHRARADPWASRARRSSRRPTSKCATAPSWPWSPEASRCEPVRSSRCSATTAPASRPWSRSCRAPSARRRASCVCAGNG